RDAGRLAGQPALRDLAHERLCGRVAGDVAAGGEHVLEVGRDDRAVRNGDGRELRVRRRRDADLVLVPQPGLPVGARQLAEPVQAARVTDAELRCAREQPRMLETGRVRAEPPQVLDHPPARLELDRGQVVDVDAAVAGETRAEEEGDVVAPGRV